MIQELGLWLNQQIYGEIVRWSKRMTGTIPSEKVV